MRTFLFLACLAIADLFVLGWLVSPASDAPMASAASPRPVYRCRDARERAILSNQPCAPEQARSAQVAGSEAAAAPGEQPATETQPDGTAPVKKGLRVRDVIPYL